MNILQEAHKILRDRFAAHYGIKSYKTVRDRNGVFCPYKLVGGAIKLVSLSDLLQSLSWHDAITFAPVAKSGDDMGMSDPFAWIDQKYEISLTALKMLAQLTKPTKVIIQTASDLIAHDDYLQVLHELKIKGHDVQVTLMHAWNLDDISCRILMPCACSSKRLDKAFEKLQAFGINVTKTALNGKAA